MTLWHVTPKENQAGIERTGLVPLIGPRSAKMQEPVPAIYMFNERTGMEDALMNWLGEELDEYGQLVTCRIELPNGFPIYRTSVGWEIITEKPIPREYISFEDI